MLKKTLYFAVMVLGLAACDSPFKPNTEGYKPSPAYRADTTQATGAVEQATPHRKLDQPARVKIEQ